MIVPAVSLEFQATRLFPKSATAMAAAIQHLYDDRALGRRMDESARKWIVDDYTREAVVKRYDEVVRAVAGE